MNDCYNLLNNPKSSDVPETLINPKKQTVCGSEKIAIAFNQLFASVLNASDETFTDITDNEGNELDVTVEIVRDALKSSSDGTGPDPIPGQILRKFSNSLSIHFYNLISFIMQSGDYPSPWKRTTITSLSKMVGNLNLLPHCFAL